MNIDSLIRLAQCMNSCFFQILKSRYTKPHLKTSSTQRASIIPIMQIQIACMRVPMQYTKSLRAFSRVFAACIMGCIARDVAHCGSSTRPTAKDVNVRSTCLAKRIWYMLVPACLLLACNECPDHIVIPLIGRAFERKEDLKCGQRWSESQLAFRARQLGQ